MCLFRAENLQKFERDYQLVFKTPTNPTELRPKCVTVQGLGGMKHGRKECLSYKEGLVRKLPLVAQITACSMFMDTIPAKK